MQFFTYIDRSNLAFAAFQFKADIHLSNSVYGLGASIFFVGYTVSQVRPKPRIYSAAPAKGGEEKNRMHPEGTAFDLLKVSAGDISSSITVNGVGCMHLSLRVQLVSPAPHEESQFVQTCLMLNAAMVLLPVCGLPGSSGSMTELV